MPDGIRSTNRASTLPLGLAVGLAVASSGALASDAIRWNPKPGPPTNPKVTLDSWKASPHRDFYTTRTNWEATGPMEFVVRDPALPNVLLIGDSISMGYTSDVRRLLKGSANVYRILGNGGDTRRFLDNHMKYLGSGTEWDLIHFNWGLHDLVRQDKAKAYDSKQPPRYSTEQYATNLAECVSILQSTGAHLIWASTTPIPVGSIGRVTGDEVERNTAAATLMAGYGIEINDLYALMKENPNAHTGPGNVHFSGPGSHLLAVQVAQKIAAKLGIKLNNKVEAGTPARLIHQWRFDGNLVEEFTGQESANSNTAAFDFVPGNQRTCLVFKRGPAASAGADQTLQFAPVDFPSGLYSVSFWFKSDPLRSSAAVLAAQSTEALDSGWEISLRNLQSADTRAGVWVKVYRPDQKPTLLRSDVPVFSYGEWHHIALTFDRQSGSLSVYADGEIVNSGSGLPSNSMNPALPITLSHSKWPLSGCVDELQVWEGVLTPDQVKALFTRNGG
jgi:acyl-CoA thioesterase-1